MSFLANNKTQASQMSERQVLETKYLNSRHNILIILVFTVINILLLVTKSNTYFLFSAYIPYLLADLGMLMCGMYPEEVYQGDLSQLEFLDNSFLIIMLAIAAVILVMYLLSWIFTKKGKMGWMVFALVFFAVDTGMMLLLNGISSDMIIDILFHAWVIYSLATGISAAGKLKKLPEETVTVDGEQVAAEQPQVEA